MAVGAGDGAGRRETRSQTGHERILPRRLHRVERNRGGRELQPRVVLHDLPAYLRLNAGAVGVTLKTHLVFVLDARDGRARPVDPTDPTQLRRCHGCDRRAGQYRVRLVAVAAGDVVGDMIRLVNGTARVVPAELVQV